MVKDEISYQNSTKSIMEHCIKLPDKEPKIGLIADTHNDFERTEKAIEIFKSKGIKTILHAGDLSHSDLLPLFVDFNFYLSFGNTDDPVSLEAECRRLHLNKPAYSLYLKHKNRNIFLFHGFTEQVPLYRQVCDKKGLSIIVKGHTHMKENFYKNGIWVINPGALHRSAIHSVGLLDTANQSLEYIDIES